MATAAVKEEGKELFKRGITQQKLADSSAGKFEATGEEGDAVRAAVHYGQAVELFKLALDCGAYEGAVRGTLAKKRDDVAAKLEGIKATLGASVAQRADDDSKQELAKWQASRGASVSSAVAAQSPNPKLERDAFKQAIDVLKEAGQLKALVAKGDDSKRPDAVLRFTEGAALLAEAIAAPKSEKVKVALEKKLEEVKATIVELGGSGHGEHLPAAPAKARSTPRRKSGSAPPPMSQRGTSPRSSFSEQPRSRSSSNSSSHSAASTPRSSFSAAVDAAKSEPELLSEPQADPAPDSNSAEHRSIPDNVDEMRPFQLKKELRMRRLDQDGTKEELAQRLKDYAAGKISPPELEKTPEQIASALVGCTLRAMKAPPLKSTADEKSSRAGNLKKGEEVIVTEYAVLNPGSDAPVIRLRCDKGWFNLNNKKGEPLLENLGKGKTPAKLPAKPKPTPEPLPAPEPAPPPVTGAGRPPASPVKAGAAAARAASTNPFKESVPILKDAAAADARVRKGDETAAPEALRLYRQGLALLEEAIVDPQFNAGVKAAMRKRVKSAASRVTVLEGMVGDTVATTNAAADPGVTAVAGKGTVVAMPSTPALASLAAIDSTLTHTDSKAVADEWQLQMEAAAAAGRAAAAATEAEAGSGATPQGSASNASSGNNAAVVTAAKSAPGVDPFKASIPLLKQAAANDARVKKGDLASAPEALRLYREGVALLMEACESPKYNDKVKAAMGKRLLLGKERLVELAKICVENDHVSLRANEPTSQPPKIDSKGATVPAGAMLDGSAPIQPVASPPEPPPAILSPTAASTALFDPTMPSSALSLPPAPALGLSGDMLRQAAEQAAASRTAVVEQAEERWAAAQEARKAKSAALAAARAEAAEQSAAAIAEAAAVEARRQAEELRKREAAAAERQAIRASAIAARQADMEARNAERHAAARRHEEAAAARRHKREQAAVSAALGAAAGQSDLSGDSIDWSGATASLAIDGLLGPLRAAMAAANVRRPLHPLPFIATQLQASTGAVVSGASNDYGDASQSGTGAIDAFSYIESYESELAQAMLSCVTECEGKEGAASLRAGQATSRLAKLLDES